MVPWWYGGEMRRQHIAATTFALHLLCIVGIGCGSDSGAATMGEGAEASTDSTGYGGAVSFPAMPTTTNACFETHPDDPTGSTDSGVDAGTTDSSADETDNGGEETVGKDMTGRQDEASSLAGGTEPFMDTGTPNDSTGQKMLPPVCGNGLIELGEECDDADDLDRDGIDGCHDCARTARFGFVTSQTYAGTDISLEWADEECALLGNIKSFPPMKWRAWLSDTDEFAINLIGDSPLPYIMVNRKHLVDSAPLFAFGVLQTAFNRDENGAKIGSGGTECDSYDSLVWTWTMQDGSSGESCENKATGLVGVANAVDVTWTDLCTFSCEQSAHIYCVEVVE